MGIDPFSGKRKILHRFPLSHVLELNLSTLWHFWPHRIVGIRFSGFFKDILDV